MQPKTEEERIKNFLDAVLTWPDLVELEEHFRSWSNEDLAKYWGLIENRFKRMCYEFGVMSPSRRMTRGGVRLHALINRLGILRRVKEEKKVG
jgi:hypothetical protein